MPLYNIDKVGKLISEMRKAVGHLKSLQAVDKETFVGDPDKIGSAKYNFIVAIESAIDICNHIIAQNGYRALRTMRTLFRRLQSTARLTTALRRI